jgi:guanylate kinase
MRRRLPICGDGDVAWPPRPGEVDGVDYFFYDTAGFESLIAQNGLVEWAEVYGHYKGIPKAEHPFRA